MNQEDKKSSLPLLPCHLLLLTYQDLDASDANGKTCNNTITCRLYTNIVQLQKDVPVMRYLNCKASLALVGPARVTLKLLHVTGRNSCCSCWLQRKISCLIAIHQISKHPDVPDDKVVLPRLRCISSVRPTKFLGACSRHSTFGLNLKFCVTPRNPSKTDIFDVRAKQGLNLLKSAVVL